MVGIENQLFAFLAAKTYYDFEYALSLPGVIFLYGIIAVIGLVSECFLYLIHIFYLKEYFLKKKKKFAENEFEF